MTYTQLTDLSQSSAEWHEARRSSLGASEVAAVLGLTPPSWGQTPRTVWLTKQGVRHDIDPQRAYFGHKHEPTIAQWIRDWHPEVGPVLDGITVRSNEYPWLTATPDRLADNAGMLIPIEIKTSSAYSRATWSEGVPDYYRIQSLVQQGVLGAPYGWLAVLHDGNFAELYKIPFDQTVWEQITRLTGTWWENHVVRNTEPPPATMFEMEGDKENTDKMVDGDERLLMAYYLDGLERSTYKEADERIEQVKAALKELLSVNGADGLTYMGKPLYTWKRSKSTLSFDRAQFEMDHPELVQKYTRLIPGSMRFLRKPVKELEADPPEGWEAGLTVVDVLNTYDELQLWKGDDK